MNGADFRHDNDKPGLFCFGMGYTACKLADIYKKKGVRTGGTVRSQEKARELQKRGYNALVFSGDAPGNGVEKALSEASFVLCSIPPDASGDPVLHQHGADIIKHARNIKWLGYFSTVGVYGDAAGSWVDEETPPAPVNERSKWRLRAEESWLALGRKADIAVHIFRLPGIYGPGRSQLEQVRRGKTRRLVKKGQVFNRIHVADIVNVLDASISAPSPGRVYNICDDEPAPPQDVVTYAAELLDIELPEPTPFDPTALSPMAASFYKDNKRVSNRRIKDELGIKLLYPNYRTGLRDGC
jgi:hypothetical protein